jgi:hypothetical protein
VHGNFGWTLSASYLRVSLPPSPLFSLSPSLIFPSASLILQLTNLFRAYGYQIYASITESSNSSCSGGQIISTNPNPVCLANSNSTGGSYLKLNCLIFDIFDIFDILLCFSLFGFQFSHAVFLTQNRSMFGCSTGLTPYVPASFFPNVQYIAGINFTPPKKKERKNLMSSRIYLLGWPWLCGISNQFQHGSY